MAEAVATIIHGQTDSTSSMHELIPPSTWPGRQYVRVHRSDTHIRLSAGALPVPRSRYRNIFGHFLECPLWLVGRSLLVPFPSRSVRVPEKENLEDFMRFLPTGWL